MKQINNKESGIAHVAVVLVAIIVIAAAVFGGWYVWQKNDKDKSTDADMTQNNQNEEKPSGDPSEGGRYFVISEWGVRFELPDDLRGDLLSYESNAAASGTILFASKKLNSLAGSNQCNLIKQPDGSYSGGLQANLNRVNQSMYPKDTFETYKQSLDHIKKIGEYDYYSSKPSELTCATAIGGNDPIPGLYEAERTINNQLKEAFTKLEAIN